MPPFWFYPEIGITREIPVCSNPAADDGKSSKLEMVKL
jgi:hypothetical protein